MMSSATALAPGLLLLLAACANGVPWHAAAPPPDIAAPPAVDANLPVPPPRKPAPPSTVIARLPPGEQQPESPAPGPAPAQAVPPREAAPEAPSGRAPEPQAAVPPRASGAFDRLIGLDQQHMVALLGSPRQRAESAPATIWRYSGPQCELDVYFYLDLQSQTLRALHYEVRSHEPSERPTKPCYDELVGERHAGAEPGVGTDSPH
jgi:hypothetical protein